MTQRRDQRSASVRRDRVQRTAAPGGDIFRVEGEYWTIVYQGVLCRLRDAKGLRYLAYLLRHPGEHVQCGDLVSLAGTSQHGVPLSAERTRVAVTKRIKAAVTKIDQYHPALGHHLIASIKTGYQCVYVPYPHGPSSWSVQFPPQPAPTARKETIE